MAELESLIFYLMKQFPGATKAYLLAYLSVVSGEFFSLTCSRQLAGTDDKKTKAGKKQKRSFSLPAQSFLISMHFDGGEREGETPRRVCDVGRIAAGQAG